MGKIDKGFSVIVALGMFFVAVVSFVYPVEYFKHIADAIVLPLFLLTTLEIIGHTKTKVLSTLSHELSKAEVHEMWYRRDYNMCKDDTDDVSEKTKKEYMGLVEDIVKINQSKAIIEKWSKYYAWVYILIGAILIASALLANLSFVIEWTSKINATAITLFTFVLFVIEPWLIDVLAYKMGQKVAMEVDAWTKEKI